MLFIYCYCYLFIYLLLLLLLLLILLLLLLLLYIYIYVFFLGGGLKFNLDLTFSFLALRPQPDLLRPIPDKRVERVSRVHVPESIIRVFNRNCSSPTLHPFAKTYISLKHKPSSGISCFRVSRDAEPVLERIPEISTPHLHGRRQRSPFINSRNF